MGSRISLEAAQERIALEGDLAWARRESERLTVDAGPDRTTQRIAALVEVLRVKRTRAPRKAAEKPAKVAK